jgi:hypothetical protein
MNPGTGKSDEERERQLAEAAKADALRTWLWRKQKVEEVETRREYDRVRYGDEASKL